jgi:hypothetical protein
MVHVHVRVRMVMLRILNVIKINPSNYSNSYLFVACTALSEEGGLLYCSGEASRDRGVPVSFTRLCTSYEILQSVITEET